MSNPNETPVDVLARSNRKHQRDVNNKPSNEVFCRGCPWHRTSSGKAGARHARHQAEMGIKAIMEMGTE